MTKSLSRRNFTAFVTLTMIGVVQDVRAYFWSRNCGDDDDEADLMYMPSADSKKPTQTLGFPYHRKQAECGSEKRM